MSVPRKRNVPNTPLGRRRLIVDILSDNEVRSQAQLENLLAQNGLSVTQATLSRDLDELGAVKIRNSAGESIYAVPATEGSALTIQVDKSAMQDRLLRACGDLMISAEASGNIVLVKTSIAGAQYLASALDHVGLEAVAGTVSGDDAFLIVVREGHSAEELATQLIDWATTAKNTRP